MCVLCRFNKQINLVVLDINPVVTPRDFFSSRQYHILYFPGIYHTKFSALQRQYQICIFQAIQIVHSFLAIPNFPYFLNYSRFSVLSRQYQILCIIQVIPDFLYFPDNTRYIFFKTITDSLYFPGSYQMSCFVEAIPNFLYFLGNTIIIVNFPAIPNLCFKQF